MDVSHLEEITDKSDTLCFRLTTVWWKMYNIPPWITVINIDNIEATKQSQVSLLEAVNRGLNVLFCGNTQLLEDVLNVSKVQTKDFKWV